MGMRQPLSGDITGFAPSRPEASIDSSPIKAPKITGRMPASTGTSNPAQPSDEAANTTQPAQPEPGNPGLDDLESKFADKQDVNPSPDVEPQPSLDELDNKFAEPQPVKPQNNAAMRAAVGTNLKAHFAAKPPPQPGAEAETLQPESFTHDFLGGLGVGWQNSVLGLATGGKPTTQIDPAHSDMAMRIGEQLAQFTGDSPAMLLGAVEWGAAGAATGGVTIPGVGAIPGAIIGGSMGAFAVPAAIRKLYKDHYDSGQIADAENPAREFASRLMATTWEAVKGGVTGAATAVVGGAAGLATGAGYVGGKLVQASLKGTGATLGAELATMTTIGAALEGHLPSPQDFLDGAIVLGGLHAVAHVAGTSAEKPNALPEKLKNIAANSGDLPHEVVAAANEDVILKQQLLAGNAQEPPQASPSKLEHSAVEEPAKVEGEKPEVVGTKTDLVPKTAEEMGYTEPEAPAREPRVPAEGELSEAAKDAEAIQEVRSKRGKNGEAVGTPWKQTIRDWYANSVDYLKKWGDYEALAKERGADITKENSAEEAARNSRGHDAVAAGFLVDGTRDAKTGDINGEGLHPIIADMEKAGGDIDELRDYGQAKNALEELTKHGRDQGLSRETLERTIRALEPKYEEFNQRMVDFGNRVLDWAAEKGRFTPEQVAQWKADHEFYSPQSRAFEADVHTGAKGEKGALLKERVNSTRDVLDPIQQRILNTEKIVKNVLTNEARSKLVTNLDAGTLIDHDGKWADTAVPQALSAVKPEGALKSNQIEVYTNGQRKVFEGSQGFIDSMKRLDGNPQALDLTTKILRGFTNAVRVGVVSNPGFGMAHYIRGQIMAAVNSKTGMIPFVTSSMEYLMKDPAEFKKFIAEGGGQIGFLSESRQYMMSDLARLDGEKLGWQDKAWNVIKSPFHASEAFIRLTDTATKFAEYSRTKRQGGGTGEALYNSRLVTPDYANVGLQRSVLRTGVAFIGAHINSLDNLYRVAERDPMGTLAKMSVMTGMSAALWLVNKDDEAIDAVPDWQKNTYWNINVSRFQPGYRGAEDATIVRIPKPWAPGIVFSGAAEQALDAWFKYRPNELGHFAENIMHSVIPPVVPNMLQPVLDQYSNKQAFTGRPLVPQHLEKQLPEMKYSPSTSETSKAIAKIIGYVPLVKDIGPDATPLASPAVVENYIKTWGGTLGAWALQASDWAGRGGASGGKAEPWEDTAILRSFVSRYPSFNDQRIQDFYENKNAADIAHNSYQAASKRGDFDAAEKIANAHPEYQVKMGGIAESIKTARDTYSLIQSNPNLSTDEKRQQLDSILFQIGSMAKMGNEMMDDFRKSNVQNNAKGDR